MSTWTHVCGAIRVDGLCLNEANKSELDRIKKVIGPMCLWGDWNEDTKLPSGSEGSLQYELHEYGNGLPWLIITIWGDLRDFDNENIIKEWFFKTIKEIGFIRDAVLKIEVEGKEPILIQNVNE